MRRTPQVNAFVNPSIRNLVMLIQAARNTREELSVIGVDFAGFPTFTNFPRTFSKEGFSLWKAMLEDKWYLDIKKNVSQSADIWHKVIQRYLKLCSTNGIFPFARSTQQSNNDVIHQYLQSSRHRLADFFTQTEMFSRVKIQSVVREYEFNPSSFTVRMNASLKPLQDPTFARWLQQHPFPLFKRGNDPGFYEKKIHANIHLTMKVANTRQPKMSYSIFCHTPFAISEYAKLPTLNKLRTEAESTLWLPAIRAVPFAGSGPRLF
jgi:hypothetical protein